MRIRPGSSSSQNALLLNALTLTLEDYRERMLSIWNHKRTFKIAPPKKHTECEIELPVLKHNAIKRYSKWGIFAESHRFLICTSRLSLRPDLTALAKTKSCPADHRKLNLSLHWRRHAFICIKGKAVARWLAGSCEDGYSSTGYSSRAPKMDPMSMKTRIFPFFMSIALESVAFCIFSFDRNFN
jgi:hypothetical protein